MTTPPEPTPTPPPATDPWVPSSRDDWVDMMSDSFVKANEKMNPPPAPPADVPPAKKMSLSDLLLGRAKTND